MMVRDISSHNLERPGAAAPASAIGGLRPLNSAAPAATTRCPTPPVPRPANEAPSSTVEGSSDVPGPLPAGMQRRSTDEGQVIRRAHSLPQSASSSALPPRPNCRYSGAAGCSAAGAELPRGRSPLAAVSKMRRASDLGDPSSPPPPEAPSSPLAVAAAPAAVAASPLGAAAPAPAAWAKRKAPMVVATASLQTDADDEGDVLQVQAKISPARGGSQEVGSAYFGEAASMASPPPPAAAAPPPPVVANSASSCRAGIGQAWPHRRRAGVAVAASGRRGRGGGTPGRQARATGWVRGMIGLRAGASQAPPRTSEKQSGG